jgi:ubiquinone/menaquinone biosynthesis C-methylase UbiE
MKNESEHIKLNEEMWDKWAEHIDGKGWRYDYLRQAQRGVISLSDIKENINFLDIGCGTGWAIGQVAQLVDNKGSFYGVDLSAKMIEKAKENFQNNDNFHFIKSNAESIPLGNNIFDVIICTNSFHHFLHPDKALKEIFRLLKSGGKIYVLDPTADHWILKMIDGIIKLFEPEHVKLYSTKEFQNLFANAGLKYVRTKIIRFHQKVHIAEK